MQLIKLIGNKTTESTIHLNNVLETRSPDAAFASQDGTRRPIERIGERHRALGVDVLEARFLIHALLALAALQILPGLELLVRNIELLRDFALRNQHVSKRTKLALVLLRQVKGQNLIILHHACGTERGFLAGKVEVLGNVIGVMLNLKLGNLLWVLRWKRARHHAVFRTV